MTLLGWVLMILGGIMATSGLLMGNRIILIVGISFIVLSIFFSLRGRLRQDNRKYHESEPEQEKDQNE